MFAIDVQHTQPGPSGTVCALMRTGSRFEIWQVSRPAADCIEATIVDELHILDMSMSNSVQKIVIKALEKGQLTVDMLKAAQGLDGEWTRIEGRRARHVDYGKQIARQSAFGF